MLDSYFHIILSHIRISTDWGQTKLKTQNQPHFLIFNSSFGFFLLPFDFLKSVGIMKEIKELEGK